MKLMLPRDLLVIIKYLLENCLLNYIENLLYYSFRKHTGVYTKITLKKKEKEKKAAAASFLKSIAVCHQ